MDKKLTLPEVISATGSKLLDTSRASISPENYNSVANSSTPSALYSATSNVLTSPESTLTFEKVVYDSREVLPGALFVALPGEVTDGHLFIEEALKRGATAFLVRENWASKQEALSANATWLVVPDTLTAFQKLAAYWRNQFPDLNVIGITGSVGKTSTKELVAAVLGQRYHVFKSPKSVNTEQSLLPVLLKLQAEDQQAVIEMGAGYVFGELERLCSVAKPRIGLVLNVSHSHLGRMGSLENIARNKSELVRSLPSAAKGGIAVLNGDDVRVKAMAMLTSARPFYYGLRPQFDLWASEIEGFGLDGIAFTANYNGEQRRLRLPLLGKHSVHTALAAAAIGLLCDLSWDEIEAGLKDRAAQVRLVVLAGLNGSTIIDDSYNASAVSSVAALDLLEDTTVAGRKLAVLGDMLELGTFEEEAHRIVGRRAAMVAEKLVVVGPLAQTIGQEAIANGLPAEQVLFAGGKDEVVEWLKRELQPGDHLLIKASRGAGLEEIVERVKA